MSLAVIEPVRLEGAIVVLEPIRQEHLDDLWEAAQPPEIWDWLIHLTDSREYFEGWVTESIESWESGDRKTFVTRSADDGRVLGSSSYLNYRPADDVVEPGGAAPKLVFVSNRLAISLLLVSAALVYFIVRAGG